MSRIALVCFVLIFIYFYSIIEISIQGIIWTLTVMKCGRKKIPILALVFRDGSWIFIVMLGTWLSWCGHQLTS